jgi:uncharacterized protein YjbI with pentapeptide repeats
MNDPVDLLRAGNVGAWNAWRSDHPNMSPVLRFAELNSVDLRGANLSGIDLRHARLRNTNLAGVDLRDALLCHSDLQSANLVASTLKWANLLRANIARADLSHADLRGADLRSVDAAPGGTLTHADFRGASLAYSDLRGSDLKDCNLNGANLVGANLSGSNLQSAVFLETIVADVDLTGATGLDATIHPGPSVIDQRTLARSGRLPIWFLRGCGLPDALIDGYQPRFASCFISYSAEDEDFARRLYSDLQSEGVRCWFAPEDMPIGADISDTLDSRIASSDRMLVILSKSSLSSAWVENEAKKALAEERKKRRVVLMPVQLDDSVRDTNTPWVATLRENRSIGDFRNWKDSTCYREALQALLRNLKIPDKVSGGLSS